jgi:acetolactate synthase-1/2/3 large subunit
VEDRKLNGGDVLVETLISRDVDTVFFVPGGTYTTVLRALSARGNAVRAVATRLESSAVFAAEAYAAIRSRPACVFVSRAPGATNASIGIHTAMQASRPVVLFVANIPRALKQREAFQEIDYQGMYGPIAKAVFDVQSFQDVARVTARALDLAVSGRPGPVVVSVSKDILDTETGDAVLPPAYSPPQGGPEAGALDAAVAAIDAARRPVLLAGEGVAFEGAHADLTAHIQRALAECDLLLVLGNRMDSVTTADYTPLPATQKLIMVHPDAQVFAAWQPQVALLAHTGPTMRALSARVAPPDAERLAWRGELNAAERVSATAAQLDIHGNVNLAQVIAAFEKTVGEDTILVSDAGTFGRWLQRYYRHRRPRTSLGPVSGAMGYGVPGGLGASVAAPGAQVVVWVGDGGFLMTGHEAAAIVQEQLPVKIIVCDNSAWGSILVHQNKRFPDWDFGTRLRSPDFRALAEAYGMPAFRVERTADFQVALDGALAEPGPALIHLRLDARDASPYSGAALADAKD